MMLDDDTMYYWMLYTNDSGYTNDVSIFKATNQAAKDYLTQYKRIHPQRQMRKIDVTVINTYDVTTLTINIDERATLLREYNQKQDRIIALNKRLPK